MIEQNIDKYGPTYYTGTQASIWVKDIWVDECKGVQFSANQSMIPVYGYASRFFDMIGKGKVIVQGVFEVNFIDEGYLYAALLEANNRSIKNQDPHLLNKKSKIDQVEEKINLLKEIISDRRPDSNPDIPLNYIKRSQRDVFGSVMQDLASMNISDLDNLASRISAQNSSTGSRSVTYSVIPFTLNVYLGHPEVYGKASGAYREIKNCYLVGNEMIIGDNDQEVSERYSFIARMHI